MKNVYFMSVHSLVDIFKYFLLCLVIIMNIIMYTYSSHFQYNCSMIFFWSVNFFHIQMLFKWRKITWFQDVFLQVIKHFIFSVLFKDFCIVYWMKSSHIEKKRSCWFYKFSKIFFLWLGLLKCKDYILYHFICLKPTFDNFTSMLKKFLCFLDFFFFFFQ